MHIKWNFGPGNGLRMAQNQVSTRFQIFMKALNQLRLALLRKVNQHIHAEDEVKLSHIDDLGQVHGSKSHHAANARFDLIMVTGA